MHNVEKFSVNLMLLNDAYGVDDLGQHWFGNGLLPDGRKPFSDSMLTYL